jgi:hypothetical protein
MFSGVDLLQAVRAEPDRDAPTVECAQRIADVVRTHTGRRWVGVYRVTSDEVINLRGAGPVLVAHKRSARR